MKTPMPTSRTPELPWQNFLHTNLDPRADGYKWSYINPIKWSKINGFHRGQHPTYVGFLTSIHGHLVEFYGKNQTWQARKNWTMKMVISYFTSMFSGHMCVFDPGCVWIWRFFLPKIKDGWFHTLTNLESTSMCFPVWVIPTLLWRDTTTMSEHLRVGRRDEGK